MADIAQLGIEIDTRKLKSGEKDLASFSNSAKTATSAVAAFIGAASVSQLIKIADGYAQMEAKVSRYTKSQIEANTTLQQLTGFANKSGAAVSDAVNVFNSLTASLESVGASKSQIMTVTEEINKLGVIGGSSIDDMRNSMRQFGQSMAGGVVRAEEFNSIIENTPEIARSIAAGMGVSMAQLRQDMLAGKLTSDAVFNALLSQVSTTNDAFAKMPRTVSQAMGQLSNNFQVVVGELNKTTGATAALSSVLDSFSNSMLSASNYTDEIVTGVELLALAYGSKLAVSIGGVISQKIADVAATNAQLTATAKETEAAAVAASIETRRAEANVLGAESAVAAAAASLALAQASTVAGTAEMTVAKAQLESARTTVALFEAERVLEAQRMAAQISDKGRIATATRMAQVEQAAAAAKANVAKAEIAYSEAVKAATAQEIAAKNALTVAESELRLAKIAKVEITAVETIAQKEATLATEAASIAARGLNRAMALLGGPAGVIMLVAGAFVYFSSKSDEAATSAENFTNSVNITKDALNALSTIQLQALEVKLQANLIDQNNAYAAQASEVASLQKELNNYSYWTDSQKQASSAYLDLQNRITLATDELERRENESSKTKSTLYGVQQTLNGNVKENYVLMQNMNSVTGIAAGIQNVFAGSLNTGNQALATRNEYVTRLAAVTTAAGQKALLSIDQQIALEKAQGVERAKLAAQYEADSKGLSATEKQAFIDKSAQLYYVQKANEDALKATSITKKAAALEDKKTAASNYIDELKMMADNQNSQTQQIQKWQDDNIAKTALYYKQGLINQSQFEFANEAIKKEANDRLKKLDDDRWSTYLDKSKGSLTQLLADQRAAQSLTGAKGNIVRANIATDIKSATFEDLPTIDAGSQTNEQNQIAQLQTQTTAMNDAYNQRIEQYKAYRALEVENAAYYDSQIAALEKKKEENNKASQEAMMNLQLQAGESMATSAADSLRKMVGEQSAAYQTMFAVQKAFSIQRAILAIKTGIASAWEAGWPNGAIYAAGVVAATGSLVSDIMSVASPSFDGGGYTGNGSRSGGLDGKGGFWAMMHPQETVIDHTKSGGPSASAGGSSSVTVNVSLQETSDTSKQGTTQQSTSDDGSVQISVFVSDIRSEGSMAQVLERTYGLTRMGA